MPQARTSLRAGEMTNNLRETTVLVVEDDEMVRDLVELTLATEGYRVLAAACPEEALALVERYAAPVHLLLTDMLMPKMSGRVLAEKLSALNAAMKVMFISGYGDDAVDGTPRADAAFLQKPFAPSALARKVREFLTPIPSTAH
jgi:two-component system cell cycle sensor histidine kinase/response regulator CckA